VRRQSEAATALWFNRDEVLIQSGVALRLSPHSKKNGDERASSLVPAA